MRPRLVPRSVPALVLVLLACLVPCLPAAGQAPADPMVALRVTGSPLAHADPAAAIRIEATLSAGARVRLWVADFDGEVVRELYRGTRGPGALVRRWKGRDAAGRRVSPGAYRVMVTATTDGEGTVREDAADAWVTVASRPVYPAAPGSITVVVDPGHGGPFDGAVGPDGTREADLNLDIGLRLARMLEGAGVGVVLTRDADRQVDAPPIDRIPDGAIDVTDDLAARVDLANAVRGDLFIAVHNNFAVDTGTGGPSTYYSDARTFSSRSRRLARTIQRHMAEALGTFADERWRPYDHGALTYPYYVLRDHDPPRLRRPSQMPGVLSEGLFLSNPRELRLLRRPQVRQAMASAYYEAVAEYLGERGSHVGYSLVAAPPEVVAGAPMTLEVEVRNQGTTPMRGWRLAVGAQPAGSEALERARPGRALGDARIPSLRPGQRRIVRLELAAPGEPGAWVLMVDALGATGARASRAGSPMLQVPVAVVGASVPGGSPQP